MPTVVVFYLKFSVTGRQVSSQEFLYTSDAQAAVLNTSWESRRGSQSSSSSTFHEIRLQKYEDETWESGIQGLQYITPEDHDVGTYSPIVGFSWNMGLDSSFLLDSTSKRISFHSESEDKQEFKNTNVMQSKPSVGFSTTSMDETLSEDIYFHQEATRCKKKPLCTSSSMTRRPLKRNIPLGTKKCSQCQTHIPAAIATCTYCGYSFRIKKELKKSSSGERGKKVRMVCHTSTYHKLLFFFVVPVVSQLSRQVASC
ncbi:hypothetical protein Gasu_56390 isoform 2 [Galdieria sulphuraria]|uniref:Uncharacterized protein n=1 Tax=Galdieria sulphuraria TaxID=130081 RepID=M2XA39_GALSU|nr:hypothetical protein Gasu_56390 isoform 2 [Galdieria sulphuraria]EME26742.1 hypothetical protein Gasu_56390 isoform 2 [Galdieria sulphuraria]|eukprot:XP_005703262.1 hypothetical protein isoform 2 [Galdieria sulphuraria]